MVKSNNTIDRRAEEWAAFSCVRDQLCGDAVLLTEGVSCRTDLVKVSHWSDLEETDFDKLAILTDGFARFIGAGNDATVITPWNRGALGTPWQLEGEPCPRAIKAVKQALADDLPMEPLPMAKPKPKQDIGSCKFQTQFEHLQPANDNNSVPAMHPEPYTPEAAGGLLGDITRWITGHAIIPVPELSLAASIALLGGIFGKLALTPTKAGVNVYLTTLLGTAGGKGWPAKAIRALSENGASGAVTNGDPTSYAAMERIIRKNSSTVVVMDEFGITLQDVNATHKNSVAAGIRKFLLAVYDQSNSVFDGRIYASSETKKDEKPIVGPALTVLGMTTVETLYAGLSQASIADGFLNRFIFVTAAPRSGPIVAPGLNSQSAPPLTLQDAVADAIAAFPSAKVGKYAVPMKDGEEGAAYRRWSEIFVWQQTSENDLAGRAAENTLRLATLRAISRNAADPQVDVGDIEWGWAIVHASIALVGDGIQKHMAASPAEALRKAIVAAVAAATGGLPYSKLVTKKGVSGANSRELYDALIWLIAADQIEDASDNKHPGAGSKFRSKTA